MFTQETLYLLIQTNQSFDYKGMAVTYHQSGKGPVMIMMHNGGCSHIIWKNQIEHFAHTHRVIAFDLLGFGNSARPKTPLTLDLYVDVLKSFIDEHQIIAPILMGNCIGAAIALEYSLRNPESVQAQILCNICGGVSMMRYFHPYMFPQTGGTYHEKLYAFAFLVSKFEFVKKIAIGRLYGHRVKEKNEIFHRLLKGLHHPLQGQSRIMLIKGLESFNKFDHFVDDASALPPTSIFWGKNNQVLPVERGQLLIDQLKPTMSKIYPAQGHLLMAEDPASFNQDVDDFLEAL